MDSSSIVVYHAFGPAGASGKFQGVTEDMLQV